jgi:hypothetical protein
MADNPDALRVGSSGKAYVAPVGTVAPVAIQTYVVGPPAAYTAVPWGVGFADLGLISEDGLSEALDEDREEWKPWGYLAPVRTQITSETTTFEFTCWETNKHVLSLRYRTAIADMTQYSPKEVQFDQEQRTSPDLRAFGFDVLDGENHFRYVIPRGEITERGDVTNKADEVIGYEFTCTAYPGSDGVSIKRMYQAGITLA